MLRNNNFYNFKKQNCYPKFKKKGKSKDSFYIGGDLIKIVGENSKFRNSST
jgi:hypothetical protein